MTSLRTIRSWILVVVLRLAVVAGTPTFDVSAAPTPPPRPHIVYILADDLGWKDVGFHGSDIRTPNIDRLAQDGARLEQFYAQPMCTPSRAALMTGRYPHRYGLQTVVILSNSKYGLATDERLLPQALQELCGRGGSSGRKREHRGRSGGLDFNLPGQCPAGSPAGWLARRAAWTVKWRRPSSGAAASPSWRTSRPCSAPWRCARSRAGWR